MEELKKDVEKTGGLPVGSMASHQPPSSDAGGVGGGGGYPSPHLLHASLPLMAGLCLAAAPHLSLAGLQSGGQPGSPIGSPASGGSPPIRVEDSE